MTSPKKSSQRGKTPQSLHKYYRPERTNSTGEDDDSDGDFDPNEAEKGKPRKAHSSKVKSGKSSNNYPPKPKSKAILRQEGVTARKEIRELRQQLNDKDEIICELSGKVFETQAQGKAFMMDGDQLQAQAADVQNLWRSWAIEYGSRGPPPRIRKTLFYYDTFTKLLNSRARPGDDGTAVTTSSTGALIILQAVLADFIDSQFFKKPYFFLRKEADSEGRELGEKAFEEADAVVSHGGNECRLATWRSMVTEYMNPDLLNQHVKGPEDVSMTKMALSKEQYYQVQARKFLDRWRIILPDPSNVAAEKRRRDTLVQAFRKAGQLALLFQIQGIALQFNLPKEAPHQMTQYVSGSELLDLHPTVNIKPGEKILDGSLIQFVVEPLLVGIKPAEMISERRQRVYGKAIVWLKTPPVLGQSTTCRDLTIIDLASEELDDNETIQVSTGSAQSEGIATKQWVGDSTATSQPATEDYRSHITSKLHGPTPMSRDVKPTQGEEVALAESDRRNEEASLSPVSTPKMLQGHPSIKDPMPTSDNAWICGQNVPKVNANGEEVKLQCTHGSVIDSVMVPKSNTQSLGKRKTSRDKDEEAPDGGDLKRKECSKKLELG